MNPLSSSAKIGASCAIKGCKGTLRLVVTRGTSFIRCSEKPLIHPSRGANQKEYELNMRAYIKSKR